MPYRLLIETITFKAKGSKESSRTVLFARRLPAGDAGLPLQRAVSSSTIQEHDISSVTQVGGTLAGNNFRVDFKVPTMALHSYNGAIINVKHTLEIKLHTTLGTNNPSFVYDIQVHSNAPIFDVNPGSTPAYALPLDWTPIVYEMVHMNADAVVPTAISIAIA